jgi:hypothetical protein
MIYILDAALEDRSINCEPLFASINGTMVFSNEPTKITEYFSSAGTVFTFDR